MGQRFGDRLRAVRAIVRHRQLALCASSILLLGVASSIGWPIVALFLVADLGLSASQAAWFFATSLLSPVIALLAGKWSDRTGRRIPLAVAALILTASGWFALAAAGGIWIAIIAGGALLTWRSVATSQLFVVLTEAADSMSAAKEIVIPTIRSGYALGYAVGRLIGAAAAAGFGFRAALVVAAVGHVVVVAPLLLLRNGRKGRVLSSNTVRADASRSTPVDHRLWILSAVVLFVSAGDSLKLMFLPVHVEKNLEGDAWVVASLFTVSALAEIVVLPLAGLAAARWGTARTIAGALLCGCTGYALLSASTALWQLYVVQLLHVAVLCAMLALSVVHAQELMPRRLGYATSAITGAQSLAAPLGSAAGSVLVVAVGLPELFVVPAIVCAVGSLVILRFARSDRERARSVPPARPAQFD